MKKEEKKKDKKAKKPYITIEEVRKKDENPYNTVLRIAREVKSRFELSDNRDESLIYKVIEDFKKDEENSSGDNG